MLLLAASLCPGQTRRALLIGIDTYQPAGTTAKHPAGCTYGRCELGTFENLSGAVNDAQSMADLLTSPKFGFPAGNVALLTNPAAPQPRPGLLILPAAQTSRDGILAAMQHFLVDLPSRGDTVVFYDASHGSLRINSKGTKLTVLVNGALVHADSTLVPSDAYQGGFDVRDREMTRIFQAALDKGVHLTVIFDSCHSGGVTRGAATQYRARTLPFDPRDIAESPDVLPDGRPRPSPTERDDNPALVFSAAQQDQEADEAVPTPAHPEAHGAFTAALIEALSALPADTPAALVYQRVKAVLEGSSFTAQEPDLDANALRRRQPLFFSATRRAAASGPEAIRAAALRSDADGTVWLDIGRISGIGVGSEFTSLGAARDPIRLRIASLQGIARSTAIALTPPAAHVSPGQVFVLSKWVPAESPPLLVWHGKANLSQDELSAAVTQIRLAAVSLVDDPATQPWTDVLAWDGANWTLTHVTPRAATSSTLRLDPQTVNLGPALTSANLKQHLAADAKLWANLPPARELATRLEHLDEGAIAFAPTLAGATYILAGSLGPGGVAYAWLNKNAFDAGSPAAESADHSPGCSPNSQYPVRSDWVSWNSGTLERSSDELTRDASRLAKVHGWLQLAESPVGSDSGAYYRLELVHASTHTALASGEPAIEGDTLALALRSDAPISRRRWVYVLDIDCHGRGSLLYPRDLTGNQFPSAADLANEFIVPGSPELRIGPPFGVDTLILLSTAQPLPDPYGLEFDGAARRGGSEQSPLQQLLDNTSHATRGAPQPVPTDWGLDSITLRSIPKEAAR